VVGAVGDLAAPLQAIAGSTNTTAATSMQSVSSLQSMNTAILGQSSLVGNILTTVSTGIMAITGALTASATAGAIGGAAGGFGSLGTGMASGGLVFGPGTGTSDSIPALLSNKEFVVNAKATKKNLRLLTAINEGRVKRMAGGGLAAYASLLSSPSYVPARSGGGGQMGNQQVINLNITGDISRQTKSEIVRMLPLIAEGVNGHNKERGYRNQAF